jgi:hypothetical protein
VKKIHVTVLSPVSGEHVHTFLVDEYLSVDTAVHAAIRGLLKAGATIVALETEEVSA